MNIRILPLTLIYCLLFLNCTSSKNEIVDEALRQYKELTKAQEGITFDGNFERWLELSYSRSFFIKYVENEHLDVLNFYHNVGFAFNKKQLYKEALHQYKNFFRYYDAHQHSLSDETKQSFRKKISFDHRGTAYAYEKLGYLDSAFVAHQKNLAFTKASDGIWQPAAQNDFGMFLVGSMKDTTSALAAFNKAYETTLQNHPTHHLLLSIRDNLGDIYMQKNQFDKAYHHYAKNFQDHHNNLLKDFNREEGIDVEFELLKTSEKLLKVLRLQGNQQLLNKIYSQVTLLFQNTFKNTDAKLNHQRAYLKFKLQYILAKNNYRSSYLILAQIKDLTKQLVEIDLNSMDQMKQIINEATLKIIKSNFDLGIGQQKAKLLNQRLIIWIISIVSFAIILVLIFIYYQRKQQLINASNSQLITRQKLELSSLKNEQLLLEIDSKKRDLADFAISLNQNQEWAKVLANKLEKLKMTKGRQRKKLMDQLENEILAKTTFDTNTKSFFDKLDKLSDSFYRELKQNFPDLSKTEKRLCSLIRLNIQSNNIAIIQNISLSSLNTSRYRLRKKLNLKKEDDLDAFIQNL